VTSQAIKQRNTSYSWGVLGFAITNSFFFLLSVLGLTAFILASQIVFDIVKYAGSAYLIYVGIQMIRSAGASVDETGIKSLQSPMRLFMQAIVTGGSNPKPFYSSLLSFHSSSTRMVLS